MLVFLMAKKVMEKDLSPNDDYRRWIIILTVSFLFAFSLLFFLSNYRLFQLALIGVYAIALLGLNLLIGYNGQFSLGHSAFYAIGAYTTAILVQYFGVPYYLTIPLAGLFAFITGFLVGFPALRLEKLYLAIATYGLSIAIPHLLKYFENWTGGAQGIMLTKPHIPFGLPLNQDQWLFCMVLIFTILLFWIGWNLIHSKIGRALVAIRDNPTAAVVMGINIPFYNTVTFGISAGYAGIAGSLGTIAILFISPDLFTLNFAIAFLVGITVGGLASLSGCLFGAFFILLIPNVAEEITKAMPEVIYGVIVIVIMYIMPTGIAGLIQMIAKRVSRKLSKLS